MKAHGADVRLIAEQAPQSALLRFGCLRLSRGKLMQALALRAGLSGVPYMTGCWPVSAQGSEKLESVTLRRANGRTWTEACDYLACGFGLIPNVELAALLGCRCRGRASRWTSSSRPRWQAYTPRAKRRASAGWSCRWWKARSRGMRRVATRIARRRFSARAHRTGDSPPLWIGLSHCARNSAICRRPIRSFAAAKM